MEATAVRRRLTWQAATVVSVTQETASVVTIELDPPLWPGHRAGQHLDVRLTADDGYTAEREYSIASAPGEPVAITVERLDDGEVSPYLTGELRAGDELELRGPVGGYFVWEEALGGPLVLIAGGSGVVPLRSMLRHWSTTDRDVAVRLLYSSRRLGEVIYHDELRGYADRDGLDLRLTLTRVWPDDWRGHRGRIDRDLVDEVAGPPEEQSRIYICGPNAFVEAAAGWLADGGRDPSRIRTERFGPTGT